VSSHGSISMTSPGSDQSWILANDDSMGLTRVGQNHIYTTYGEYTVFLAGKPPNIRSYTVYIYSCGQP